MGRYLDHHGTADNPLQGLSLGWDLSPSLAASGVPVATVSAPDDYDFWARGVWGPVERAMLDGIGDLGAGGLNDVGLRQARRATTAMGQLRAQMEPFQAGYSTPQGITYPTGSDFASASRRWRPCWRRDCRCAAWPSRPRADTTPMPIRHRASPATCRSQATACSPSSATSRPAGWPTACW